PDRAAFENFTAFQRHRAERSSRVALVLAGIEGVRPAPRAVHRWAHREADLVDQAGPQKRAVRLAAAFEQQPLDPQLAVQGLLVGTSGGKSPVASTDAIRLACVLAFHTAERGLHGERSGIEARCSGGRSAAAETGAARSGAGLSMP